jgi:hypothetical protein
MTTENPFKYFKTSPEIIRLAVMYYIRYPLSFRQVEDILHERGIDICYETARVWVNRFDARLLQQISYHPMAPLFVKLALLTSNYVGAGPTTDARIHTCRFDGESEQCSYLKLQPRSRGLSVITVKYTTTSITKGIFKTDRLISKDAVPLSLSGSKSALHRFV